MKTSDDGQKVCPKHVELFTGIKLRISVARWLYYKNIKNEFHSSYHILSRRLVKFWFCIFTLAKKILMNVSSWLERFS